MEGLKTGGGGLWRQSGDLLGGRTNNRRRGRGGSRYKQTVCLCAHNVSVCACKWEKYARVPQVTGLRGHIIDPFGGKMTGL